MGFFDLFRPKWKHSDVEVRAEAVRALGAEDLTVLAQIVRLDKDVKVRRVALKKIADPALLVELAAQDPDEGLRKDAAEKAAELLLDDAASSDEPKAKTALSKLSAPRAIAEVAKRSPLAVIRAAALARISDEKFIGDVAKKAADATTRLAAVERLSDAAALREVAIGDAQKDVALAALTRLSDEKALEQVAGRAKLKAIKKAARDRIAALHEAARPADGKSPTERRAEQALLCRTVEEAAASDDWEFATVAVEASKTSWAALGTAAGDEPLARRFERALTKFNLRREEASRRRQALATIEAQKRAALPAPTPSLSPEAEAEDAALRAIVDAAQPKADTAAERDKREALRVEREAARVEREAQKVAERQRRDEEAAENQRRLEEIATRLESLIGSDDKKTIDNALRNARDIVGAARNLPKSADAARARYDAARAKLVGQSEELREAEDWKRWANVPRLEALCVRVEALLAEAEAVPAEPVAVVASPAETPPPENPAAEKLPFESLPLESLVVEQIVAPSVETPAAPKSDLGAALKALQAEWKTVGAAPKEKSEALWKRFKQAADLVYERVRGRRPAQKEDRAVNAEKKEALCVRADELAGQPDDTIHFKQTGEQIKTLQEEWKALGPAPTREQSDALWKRFRGACDRFFERRQAHFAERDEGQKANVEALEALCVKAEKLAALADHGDWKAAAELMKQYQADWKAVGAVGKQEALWTRFRAACDDFFEKRKTHFAAMDDERAANLKKKEALCEKAEAVAAAVDSNEMTEEEGKSEAKRLQSEWKASGPVAKDIADVIWGRFRGACDRVFAHEHRVAPEDLAAAEKATGISGFATKLPLGDIAARLAAAQPEPDQSQDKDKDKT